MYDELNEMNKALRFKSGAVFTRLIDPAFLKSTKENIGKGNEKGHLEDEEAVLRMFKIIDQ